MKKGFVIATIIAAAVTAGAAGTRAQAAEIFKFNGGIGILINGSCIPGLEIPKPELPEIPDQPEETVPDQPDVTVPDQPEETVPDQPDVTVPDQPEETVPDQPEEEETEMSFERQVAELVNQERVKAGLSPLEFKSDVAQAAAVRAKEIKTSFSHTRPNGSSFSTALKEQGVTYKGTGENIAWGQKSPEQVMNAWMNSAGHRANILNEKFTSIGVGYYQDSSGTKYWTQLFTY